MASAPSKLQKRTAGGVVIPKRSAESLESPPSSATASVKASFPTDVAATCDPDGEWAMSPPFVCSLSSCGGVGVGEAREPERCGPGSDQNRTAAYIYGLEAQTTL